MDEFGDAYERDVGVEELVEIMGRIDGSGTADGLLSDDEMEMLGELPGWCLKGCKVVIYGIEKGVERKSLTIMIRIVGGEVVEELERGIGVSHVVVEEREKAVEVRKVLMEWVGEERMPRVVGKEWVEECVKEGTRLEEERFAI